MKSQNSKRLCHIKRRGNDQAWRVSLGRYFVEYSTVLFTKSFEGFEQTDQSNADFEMKK